MAYRFSAELWEWSGKASYFFVSLPEDHADDIEERHGRHTGGFGSVRVEVTVGATTWRTSLFPDSKGATYVLPIKAAVRSAEGIEPGSIVDVSLDPIVD